MLLGILLLFGLVSSRLLLLLVLFLAFGLALDLLFALVHFALVELGKIEVVHLGRVYLGGNAGETLGLSVWDEDEHVGFPVCLGIVPDIINSEVAPALELQEIA